MTDRPAHLLSNNPPPAEIAAVDTDEVLAEFREELEDRILPAFSDERLVVTDNATIGTTADKIAIARAFWTRVDNRRKELKQPYDQAATAIQSKVAGFLEPVEAAVRKAESRITDCRKDMRERAAAAAQVQLEAEARLRAAAAARKAPAATVPETGTATAPETGTANVQAVPKSGTEPVVIHQATVPVPQVRPEDIKLGVARGELGSKVSDQDRREWRITDARKLPDTVLNAAAVQKAILQAVKQLARLTTDIPGAAYDDLTGDKIRRAG